MKESLTVNLFCVKSDRNGNKNFAGLYVVSNDKAVRKNDKIHGRKLQKLIANIHEASIIDNGSHDPSKVIYNFSNYHLTDSDKSLLTRGLNFAILLKNIEFHNFCFRLNSFSVA